MTYRVGTTIHTGLSLNVSKGGLALRTTSPPEINAVVKVRFRLPKGGHDIDVDARVAWATVEWGWGCSSLASTPPIRPRSTHTCLRTSTQIARPNS